MIKFNQRIILTALLLIFTFISNPALAARTNETGSFDDAADKPSTAFAQDLTGIPNTETKSLIEQSAFHRYIKGAKYHLSEFGQQLAFVLSKYLAQPTVIPL